MNAENKVAKNEIRRTIHRQLQALSEKIQSQQQQQMAKKKPTAADIIFNAADQTSSSASHNPTSTQQSLQ